MRLKQWIWSLVIASSTLGLSAQDIVLEQSVIMDSLALQYGPNGKKFTHTFLKYGLLGGTTSTGSEINLGRSYEMGFGVQHKRKLGKHYDMTFAFLYNFSSYSIKQTASKNLPDSIQHEKESIAASSIQISWLNRINFGKRGNVVKTFLDVGAYGGYNFGLTHTFLDKNVLPNTKDTEVRSRGLEYANRIEYGAIARIGYKKFALYYKYRVSSFILSGYGYNDLPNMVVGLEADIF